MRKLFIGIIIVLVVLGGLAAVKTMQIKTMIDNPWPQTVDTVASAVVHQETWQDTLSAVGSVSAAQGVTVAPEVAGTVSKIDFESGAPVKQGDLLLKLDTSSEDAQLRAAKAQVDWAQVSADRLQKLREDKTVSQSELDQAVAQLKQAKANADAIQTVIEKKTIRAPFSGKLGIRLVNLGEQLSVGSGIVSLQSLAPIFVDFSLPQQDFALLQNGLKVRAVSDAYPTNEFEGEISAINPDLDPVTRSVRIRAKFENADERLRAGMFVRVTLLLPQERQVLVIPQTAILSQPYGDSVFLIAPDKNNATNLTVQSKLIRTGRSRGDFISVETGLKPGDRVASDGVFKLRNGVPVHVNNEFAPQPSKNPNPPNS
jgi:membrane fusion protein, multidrug efflux system